MRYAKLGRTNSQRRALLRNLVTSLFLHDKIRTTTAKAKQMRPIAEKLVTIAKNDNFVARRRVAEYVLDPEAVKRLFAEIAPKYAQRSGGYTRIVKLSTARRGDAAEEAIIEFV